MIDPEIDLEEKLKRQEKIIQSLMARIERGENFSGNHFSVFQSAVALHQEYQSKSARLDETLTALGLASNELEIAYHDQRRSEKNLADAIEAIDGGLALFGDDGLIINNRRFEEFVPDLRKNIRTGLALDRYLDLLSQSPSLVFSNEDERKKWEATAQIDPQTPNSNFVLPLRDDRWFQLSIRPTSFGNIAVTETDITMVVRQNRVERAELIDAHTRYVQGAFDNLSLGVASFSDQWALLVENKMFTDLLNLPIVPRQNPDNLHSLLSHIGSQLGNKHKDLAPLQRWLDRSLDHAATVITLRDRVLDLRGQAHPEGGYILSVQDITSEHLAASALRQLNETLEDRVKSRTKALRQANLTLKSRNTTLAQAEDRLREAKEAAEAANASKTLFLAEASHDLLQPVNAAKLYLSLIQDDLSAPAVEQYFSRLAQSFKNVETLLHDLLDLSRLESPSSTPTHETIALADIFQDIADGFAPDAEQRGLELRMRPTTAFVRSDRNLLRRILQNLTSNALRYTNNGGVLIAARRHGKKVAIEVWDTGIGIPKDEQQCIFEVFTRGQSAESQSGSMGLGLAIVDRAVAQLGHNLSLCSTDGRGTRFRLELDRISAPKELREPKITPQKHSVSKLRGLRACLIDNDPDVLDSMTAVLERWGIDVISGIDGDDVLNKLRKADFVIDFAIVDYMLNDNILGTDFIAKLRQRYGDIPLLMITANQDKALIRASEIQNFELLAKPVNIDQLRQFIAHAAENQDLSRI